MPRYDEIKLPKCSRCSKVYYIKEVLDIDGPVIYSTRCNCLEEVLRKMHNERILKSS